MRFSVVLHGRPGEVEAAVVVDRAVRVEADEDQVGIGLDADVSGRAAVVEQQRAVAAPTVADDDAVVARLGVHVGDEDGHPSAGRRLDKPVAADAVRIVGRVVGRRELARRAGDEAARATVCATPKKKFVSLVIFRFHSQRSVRIFEPHRLRLRR